MTTKPKTNKSPRPFVPYRVGDWIVPNDNVSRRSLLYKCRSFSGNYVFADPFPHGEDHRLQLVKNNYTKATNKDIAKAVAWRLRGKK